MSSNSERLAITSIDIWPIDIGLSDPFVISRGRISTAKNLFVKVTLKSGGFGFGEIAPFPELTGETRDSCLVVAEQLSKALLDLGLPVTLYRKMSRVLMEMDPSYPAVRCGLETAIIDSFCRNAGIPMWALWGGADVRARDIDITIPITGVEQSVDIARRWYSKGFRIFKTKVGIDVDDDIRRLAAINRSLTDVTFVVDANQGFTESDALFFAESVKKSGCKLLLFEQPVAKDDLEGMASLKSALDIPIGADESVMTIADAKSAISANAADVINLKIMKSGVIETLDIAALARISGLQLMIGGMVETRIAMGCSLSIVLGIGGIQILDLDTPLLMVDDPVVGGYEYTGASVGIWRGAGLSMQPKHDLAHTGIRVQ
jgi:L-alanine-DL-glutamate epimerase-like enolase superfamily enzyme